MAWFMCLFLGFLTLEYTVLVGWSKWLPVMGLDLGYGKPCTSCDTFLS